LRQSPPGELYTRVAPRPDDWPVLVAKTAELLHQDYDWAAETEAMTTPALLVFADADSIRPAHIVEFFALLGGGLHDAGWDRSRRPVVQLAILPGTTHYDITGAPALGPTVAAYLDGPLGADG
jgi:pimeloyl-ACP methyl ester carboxylesterase